MADRKDFYYRQKVTEAELDAAFDGLEVAERSLASDHALVGIVDEAEVTEHTPNNLTVDVSGPAIVYDPLGQRVAIPSTQNVDMSVDNADVTTSVASPGNSKIVSLFAQFDRSLSDPRIDGNSNTVYFERDESFAFYVKQGSESVSPSPASLESEMILLADVTLIYGQTQITDSDISYDRRQDVIVVDGFALSVREGTTKAALLAMIERYNDHIEGTADAHVGGGVDYGGGGTWADGTTNPSTTVEGQLDKIITDLASAGGTAKIYGSAISGTPSIAAGTLASQLAALKLASNLEYGGSGNWAAGGSGVSAGTIEAALDEIVTDLIDASGSDAGGYKIGMAPTGLWKDATGLSAATVGDCINEILSDLGSSSASVSGARKVGFDITGLSTWKDGSTLSTGSVWDALGGIITALGDSTGVGANGASRIGFAAQGNLSSDNVEDALAELDSEKAKQTDVQLFSSPGANVWTKPTGAKWVVVELVGGGGGGGSGRRGAAGTDRFGGGGGGGGARTIAMFDAAYLSATETATVGAGGAGGAARSTDNTSGANGVGGGESTFTLGGTIAAKALGGGLGAGGTAASGNSGYGGSYGDFFGGNGGDGAVATAGVDAQGYFGTFNWPAYAAAGGGGGGGGIDSADVERAGGDGWWVQTSYSGDSATRGQGGAVGGASPTNGSSVAVSRAAGGAGGGGGAAQAASAGQGGGDGGTYGGGGGGGAGSLNTHNSGAGGDGADGVVIVTTHF